MPLEIKNKISRFNLPLDAKTSLIGKLMLMRGLNDLGIKGDLSDLRYDEFGKPSIKDINFSISHSDSFVICAVSKTINLGIDVEKIMELNLNRFRSIFQDSEWAKINLIENDFTSFYFYWCAKESIAKAIGKGLGTGLREIKIEEGIGIYKGHKWHLKELKIDPEYVIQLSTDRLPKNINIINCPFMM